jgi:hypothetical protein
VSYRLLQYLVLAVVLLQSIRPAEAEDIPAYGLQMQTDPKFPGKHRIIEGHAGVQPDRFFLEGLGVLTPVAVTIIAKNPGDEITVSLGQDRWDETIQKITTTKAAPEVTKKLRTQGDLKISVTAASEDKQYWLIVWVGDEVKPDLAPVTVPMTKYKREHPDGGKAPVGGAANAKDGGTSPVMIVIAVALVLIVLLLAVVVFRKKGKS